ncbi:MAG: HAD family phosphatase [Chloroflexi bacterium]|nr:HAD family phosphatase [Chloroflexota bacterium]
MFRTLIFDFDGVIINTEMADLEAWRTIYGRYGHEFPLALWQQNIGSHNVFNPLEELAARANGAVDRQAIQQAFETLDQEMVRQLPIMPGVRDRMAEARQLGMKLTVASSSPANWLNYHLPVWVCCSILMLCELVRMWTAAKSPTRRLFGRLCGVGVSPTHALQLLKIPCTAWRRLRRRACFAWPCPMRRHKIWISARPICVALPHRPFPEPTAPLRGSQSAIKIKNP